MEGAARILYVDDEPGLCRLFARLFADDPRFQVSTLTSSADAANLIRTQSST